MVAGAGGSILEAGHHHVVQFYGHDRELIDNATSYLGEALAAGGVAVVVATAAHRDAFAARLADDGVDLAAATADGRLVLLDADETMRRFLVADRPDPEGFETVIGGLVGAAGRDGGPVHVYGEMVALLWDLGHVNAALELEELWNDLGRRLPFSLYCSYPTASVSGAAQREVFAEVCRLHSAVVGEPAIADGAVEASETFPATLEAPRAARHFVLRALEGWGRQWADETLAVDAALTVTELATNAVRHARSPFTVTVRVTSGPRVLHIAVSDANPATPAAGAPSWSDTSGRGLGLVAALAAAWGAEPLAEGKVVWAELCR